MGEGTYQVRVSLLGTFGGQREKKGRALEWLTNPDIWIAFITLTALEIVLGIVNIISILADKLPQNQ